MTDREKLIELIMNLTDEEAKQFLLQIGKQDNCKKYPYHRFIYSIKHNVTGKEYIGRTQYLEQRIAEHMSALRRGKHPSKICNLIFTCTETIIRLLFLNK